MTTLLESHAATFSYFGKERSIGPFSLTVRAGELHRVRGVSGSGKSTCARMLTGVIPQLYRGGFRGVVRAGRHSTIETPLWQYGTKVGLVGQNPTAQLLGATVCDEILFGMENLGLPVAEMKSRLDDALQRFGLTPLAERDPLTLSGGEQHKLILAAITARQPGVIVLDEAFSMLDAESTTALATHIEEIRKNGTAIVAFEHRAERFPDCDTTHVHELPGIVPAEHTLPELPQCVAPFRVTMKDVGVELGRRTVLDVANLTFDGGRVTALFGPNGAGKTTLLRCLAGLQRHSGRILTDDGQAHGIGLCFQNADQQIFNPTVREEICFGNPSLRPEAYRCVLDLLGLTSYAETPPMLLSEGEKKRLALAILLTRPGLRGLCLDEPTVGQDDAHRTRIGRILRHLSMSGFLCVVATHDREWAARWCDDVVELRTGKVVSAGDPSQ